MWNLSVNLNNITNLINLSYQNVIKFFNNISSIYKLIDTKCNNCIVICLKTLLNQIKIKLHQLYSELRCLYTFYGFFNLLKSEWDMTIMSLKYIPNINEKLSELIDKFKCSLSEFTKIESCINCAKSTIQQINELKQKLSNLLEKILLLICISNHSSRLSIVITNAIAVKKRIKSLDRNIDSLCSDIIIIQSHNNSLKLIYSNVVNFIISNNIKDNNLLFSIFNTDIDEICSLFNWFNFWTSRISNICCCDPKCTCDCKCETKCTSYTICLCLCNGTKTVGTECCICICKHENCKCVCICLCNNKDCGTQHQCKKCLLKLEVGTLKDRTSTILNYLNYIRCYVSIFEKRCCYCSCVNWRCDSLCCIRCQSIIRYYKSIISRIQWIESLFNQVGANILQLGTLKNILILMSAISTPCKQSESCGCKDKIKDLIDIISVSCRYYYRVKCEFKNIGSFVEYKFNYNKTKQILNTLPLSIKPFLNKLGEINNDIIKAPNHNISTNGTSRGQINRLFMSVYSQYSFIQCYIVIPNLSIYSSKLSIALNIMQGVEYCECVNNFNSKGNYTFKTTYFHKYLVQCCNKDIDDLKKLIPNNEGNHLCLCLVIKYVLYPNLIKSFYYIRQIYLGELSKLTREFTLIMFGGFEVNEVIKMLFIIIYVVYIIMNFINKNYIISWTGYTTRVEVKTYCSYHQDPYYYYIISTILFLSSLIENIWTIDNQNIRMSIEKLSLLYSQLEIYDLNSTSMKRVCCNPVYSLIVHKECKQQLKDKCCCCWCVTCFNLAMILISLCLQCKLCKALCNDKKKGNGCEKLTKCFQEVECKDKEKGLCCLIKLSLYSQIHSSDAELKKKIEELSKECKDENGCKKILEKIKSYNCKLLLLGCECECTAEKADGQVKGNIVTFKNPWVCTRVAVVVFCKCKDDKGCCLYQLVENFKSKIQPKLEKICTDGQCVCEDLKKGCDDLCCPNGSCDNSGCPCKDLKEKLEKICKGNGNCGGECLCKQIDEIIKKCKDAECKCKDKDGCCKCPCCKMVTQSIILLTRACKANVLEPYKRILTDLVASDKNKKELMVLIVKGINQTRLNNIYLIKNNHLTSHNNEILNTKYSIESRNWGYETLYEHQVTTPISFSDRYNLLGYYYKMYYNLY